MPQRHPLHDVIASLRSCQRVISKLSGERPDDWRRKLVAERRVLSERMQILVECVAADPVDRRRDRPVGKALSALRSALAAHQADYPAVSLDPATPAFRASAGRVRAAFNDVEAAMAALDHNNR